MNEYIYICLIPLSIVGLLFIILKLYDYYLIKKEISSRRDIGLINTNDEWYKLIRDICCAWIIHMPKVQVSDNMNFILIEKIRKQYYKDELQAWQKGGLFIGLAHYLIKYTEDIKVNYVISNALESTFDSKYMWKVTPEHIDYALLAYSIMKLPQYSNNYYEAMNQIANVIKNSVGDDGTTFYRKHISKYRLVDTIGMICPFLIRFGQLYNRPDLVELAIIQIEKYVENGLHPLSNIPVHGYHVDSKMPIGIYGWGRGVGWYALGLIDSYEELERSHYKKEYLKNNIIKLSESLVKYQRDDGGWGHSIFIENNIYDSSATAMIIYFLKNSLSFNIINGKDYEEAIKKGTERLKLSTRLDGVVDFSQGDTKGVGLYSNVFRELPFTQGMVLSIL